MTLPSIMVAPTGARRGKADHPAMPLTLPEIVAEARACWKAGAAAIHAHVRDDAGRHSLDAGLYRELLAELALAVPAMAVQVSTEAAGIYAPSAQRELLDRLRPPWASVALRELMGDGDERAALGVLARAAQAGTRFQFILYDAADRARLGQLVQAGRLPGQGDVETISVMGSYSGKSAQGGALNPLLAALREQFGRANTAICAFGPGELQILARACRAGFSVRVGFENNTLGPDGCPAADNAAQVAALIALAQIPRSLRTSGAPNEGTQSAASEKSS